ncbi:uncharacterized protein YaiI (UPF0178 family) [Microbacterium testaceum]|uniref:hypothetical protein n=1 Tax=Microbacterium testaceum TaxID=2033 RepID=UPI00278B2262|nr:hypothetical protein [Microbacterium testaceum]MDQ1174197.1 uncharacterized protein YaiI (UPF0178 family) [Microbacterium testaceum]
MAAAKPRRTQVDAIDDLTAQIRLSNALAALALPASALEHDGKAYTNEATQERVNRRNAQRAVARAGLEGLLS